MAVSKLIQITDLHLGEGPQSVLAGIRPLDSFKAVLHAINDYGRGDDLLLLSGDLSGTSSAESYIMLNQLLKDYDCLLYTSPRPRERQKWSMPSSA